RALSCLVVLALGGAPGHAQDLDVSSPLATLDFAVGSSDPGSDAADQLAPVAAWAHDHPWRLLLVHGHAAPSGGPAATPPPSPRRADAVRVQLIALGVAPERIVGAAYGEGAPDASRRVDVLGTSWDYRPLLESQRSGNTNASRPRRQSAGM